MNDPVIPCARSRFLPFLADAVGLLVLTATPGWAQDRRAEDVHEEQFLLLAVWVEGERGRTPLSEAVGCYLTERGLLVPLGEIARLAGFDIDVDPARGIAQGFLARESRTFFLDITRREVEIEGRGELFDPDLVEVREGDIVVAADLLGRWLSVDLEADFRALTLTLHPREPLPAEERGRRRELARRLLARNGVSSVDLPRIGIPYALWDAPFADVTLAVASRTDGGRSRLGVHYGASASADLLYMTSMLRLTGDEEDPLADLRFTLGRLDPDGGLLGPLDLREAMLGYVTFPASELIARSAGGPGLRVSGFPLDLPESYDAHTLRGELPPGWEVQLYRNEVLVGYQPEPRDGDYEFRDLPLLFGVNVFRLEFHGPHGERRTERRVFHIGRGLTPPGRSYYRFVTNRPLEGGSKALLELDHGIAKGLAGNLAIASIKRHGERSEYARAGLRSYGGPIFGHADFAMDGRGGLVAEAGLQARLGVLGIIVRRAWLEDYRSEVFEPIYGAVRDRTLLRLDGRVALHEAGVVPFVLELRRDGVEGGGGVQTLRNRVSLVHRTLNMTNDLQWTFGRSGGIRLGEAPRGTLLLSKPLSALWLRGGLEYETGGSAEVRAVTLTLEPQFAIEFRVTGGVTKRFEDDSELVSLAIHRIAGPYGFGVSATYSSALGAQGLLSLTLGLGRRPRDGEWSSRARPTSWTGGLSAHVFLDENRNHVRDAGEEDLEGIGLVGRSSRSGPDGIVFVGDLPPHQNVEVIIDEGTLEDPLWVPGSGGIRIVPRPGKVAVVDLPVHATGEILGTVYLSDGDTRLPAAGVRVELVGPDGRLRATATSAYDGFFDLTRIAPGRYRLRISGEAVGRLGIYEASVQDVTIGPEGSILDGIDLVGKTGRNPAPGPDTGRSP